MRHIGQKFRFVFTGLGHFFRLAFNLHSGTLQVLVGLLYFLFLLIERLVFFFKLLIGRYQLILIGLQLLFRGPQTLGLLFQLFIGRFQLLLLRLQDIGLLCCRGQGFIQPVTSLGSVDRHSDFLTDSFKKRDLYFRKSGKGAKFEHRFDAVIIDKRNQQDILRPLLSQTGGDPDIIFRYIANNNRLLFQSSLPDHPFTDSKTMGKIFSGHVGITGPEMQHIFFLNIKGTYLGPEIRGQIIHNFFR